MLRSIKDLENYTIRATDGDIGRIIDFYFNDVDWVIRYLVVDTGTWLSGRKVVITSNSLGYPDWTKKVLPVSITKAQVKNSPNIETNQPITRQHELEFLKYYDKPLYWDVSGQLVENSGSTNGTQNSHSAITRPNKLGGVKDQALIPHSKAVGNQSKGECLRSCKTIMEYHITAIDGDIGHVGGLLVDEETWAIRYLIADTSDWWIGHQVIVAPRWIEEVRWADDAVSVDLTRQALKEAPPYNSTLQLGREAELAVHKHHGRSGYWMREAEREEVLSPD